MTLRKLHKTIGLILLLPFVTWSLTAVFFLVRPRYEQAYETLAVRAYPLEAQAPALERGVLEQRFLRSVLGDHLLVRDADGWQQLDPISRQPRPAPDAAALRLLVEDAITANSSRYGSIATQTGMAFTTTTGVNIGFNWPALTFTQQGRDTWWINKVYDIHYLEWTGIRVIDKILGLSGLALLLYMTWTGARLALSRQANRRAEAAR